MLAKRVLTVTGTQSPQLARFLVERLQRPDADVAQLIATGAVFVGAQRAQLGSQLLPVGQRVTVYAQPATQSVTQPAAPQPVYSDNDLVVFHKPAGLPSQPGRRGGPSLQQVLPPGAVLMHRLDAEASGLILAAKQSDLFATLQHSLERGALVREYLAVVSGVPKVNAQGEGVIALRIGGRAQSGPMSSLRQCFPETSQLGEAATTLYRVLATSDGATPRSLLWLRLLSGRTHQIRVHLAALGHAIVGDSAYGGASGSRLLLHAARLRLRHPRTRRKLLLWSPPPDEFLVDFPAARALLAQGATELPQLSDPNDPGVQTDAHAIQGEAAAEA